MTQRFRLPFALVPGLALALAACGQTAVPPVLPEVTLVTSDAGLQAPATLTSGLVAVTLRNTGQRVQYTELARLKTGATQAQVQAALTTGNFAALDTLVTESGATADVDPGGSTRVILDLAAGSYLVLDHGTTPDAPPVIAGTISVTSRVGPSVADPTFNVKVVGTDFAYDLPKTVKAGAQLWQFVNAGQEAHELILVKLHDGKTAADVQAFLDQPNPDFSSAPGDPAGGNSPISAGIREFFPVNLPAGNYVALCGVPDPATGKSHFDLGMIMAFTVSN